MYMQDIKTYYGGAFNASDEIGTRVQRFYQMNKKSELAPEYVATLLHCLTKGRSRNGLRLRYDKALYGR